MTPTNFWIIFYLSDQLGGGFLGESLAKWCKNGSEIDQIARSVWNLKKPALEGMGLKQAINRTNWP
jgi:hypothetical protein